MGVIVVEIVAATAGVAATRIEAPLWTREWPAASGPCVASPRPRAIACDGLLVLSRKTFAWRDYAIAVQVVPLELGRFRGRPTAGVFVHHHLAVTV